MAINVIISDITGATPYDLYICQVDGSSCFYINTITYSQLPFEFDIPAPYDTATQYMLKVIDNNNCVMSGTKTV